ncbi:hypothetical protein M1D48_14530 [Erwinia sp. D4-22]
MQNTNTRQRWLCRLLACCGFTLGGIGLEGMWGDALKMDTATQSNALLATSSRKA